MMTTSHARRLAAATVAGALLGVIGFSVSHAACSSEDASIPGGSVTVTGCAGERTPHGEPWTDGDQHRLLDEQTYAPHQQGYAYSRTHLHQSRGDYEPYDVSYRETYLFIDRALHVAPLDRYARARLTARQWDGRAPGFERRWTFVYAEASTSGSGGNAEAVVLANQYRWDDPQCRQSTGARVEALGEGVGTGDPVIECPVEAPLLPEVP